MQPIGDMPRLGQLPPSALTQNRQRPELPAVGGAMQFVAQLPPFQQLELVSAGQRSVIAETGRTRSDALADQHRRFCHVAEPQKLLNLTAGGGDRHSTGAATGVSSSPTARKRSLVSPSPARCADGDADRSAADHSSLFLFSGVEPSPDLASATRLPATRGFHDASTTGTMMRLTQHGRRRLE